MIEDNLTRIWVEMLETNVLKSGHWMRVGNNKPVKISIDKWFKLYDKPDTIVLQPLYVNKL